MDFTKLSEKLSKLKKINYLESAPLELPDGTKVILSTLDHTEETLISSYIIDFERAEFLQVAKLENLAHSLKEIQLPDDPDKLDFRDVTLIPSGETVAGKAVNIQKHVFVRNLITTWPEIVLDYLYRRMLELTTKLEEKVSKKIKVERSDEYRRQRLESLADALESMIEEAVNSGQEDIKTVFDFTPAILKAKRQQVPSPAEQFATEKKEEARKEIVNNILNKPKADLPANYDQLPEAEKQLLREMAESPDEAAAIAGEKRVKKSEEEWKPEKLNPLVNR